MKSRYRLGRVITSIALFVGFGLLVVALVLIFFGPSFAGALSVGGCGLAFVLAGEVSEAVFDMADKILGLPPLDIDLDSRP
ncbi:MAG: hypothetical protein R3F22_08360 [Lysobacteraceae bacterium]